MRLNNKEKEFFIFWCFNPAFEMAKFLKEDKENYKTVEEEY